MSPRSDFAYRDPRGLRLSITRHTRSALSAPGQTSITERRPTVAQNKTKAVGEVKGLGDSVSHLLHRAQQIAADFYAAEMKGVRLTHRQYVVLAAVAEHPGALQADLTRMTGVDRSTLAEMIARLDALGLVERSRSERDARGNAVVLTPAGVFALDEARPKVAAADARLLRLIGGKQRDAVIGALRGLAAAEVS